MRCPSVQIISARKGRSCIAEMLTLCQREMPRHPARRRRGEPGYWLRLSRAREVAAEVARIFARWSHCRTGLTCRRMNTPR